MSIIIINEKVICNCKCNCNIFAKQGEWYLTVERARYRFQLQTWIVSCKFYSRKYF